MFSFFKRKNKQGLGRGSNSADANLRSGTSTQDQILKDYETRRFSPLDIDLSKLDSLNKAGSSDSTDPYHIIKQSLKHSNIPIYTGNPFNPYF